MRKTKILFPLLILVVFVMSSCTKDQEFIIAGIELDDEFEVALHEDWTQMGTELFLKIRSSKIYACDNLGLKSSLVKTLDNKLIINIQEVIVNNEDCTGEEAAQGYVYLGDLEKGEYKIEIALLGQLKSEGSLNVNQDTYDLMLEENTGINVQSPLIKKTPDHTLFGFIIAKDPNDQNSVSDEFIEIMESAGTPFENSGVYGRFEVLQNGNVSILDTSEDQIGSKVGFAISSNEDHQKILDQIPALFCEAGHQMFVQSTTGLSKSCN